MDAGAEAVLSALKEIRSEVSLYRAEIQQSIQAQGGRMDRIEAEVSRLASRVDYLENQSRRNNLVFYGIEEDAWETWEKSEEKVKKLVREKLGIDLGNKDIERAHRTGRRKGRRPIVAKFAFFKDREAILRAGRNFSGSGVWVEEDFSERVREERRFLKHHLIEARRQGYHAVLRFDKLVVDGKVMDRAYLVELDEVSRRNNECRSREVEGGGKRPGTVDRPSAVAASSPPAARTRSKARKGSKERVRSRSRGRGRGRSGSRYGRSCGCRTTSDTRNVVVGDEAERRDEVGDRGGATC